jgi:hypothetical protein
MSLSTVTYRIITASVTTNVGSFVLSTVEGLEVGVCIRAYGTGEPRLDRRHNIATIDTDTKTITFDATGPNITAFNPANASIVPLVTWVKDADVAVFLGYEPEAETIDETYLADVVEAANDFGYRRRQQAGYIAQSVGVTAGSTKRRRLFASNHRPDHGRQPCSGGRPADSCADR